jgi:hypothetical protein
MGYTWGRGTVKKFGSAYRIYAKRGRRRDRNMYVLENFEEEIDVMKVMKVLHCAWMDRNALD